MRKRYVGPRTRPFSTHSLFRSAAAITLAACGASTVTTAASPSDRWGILAAGSSQLVTDYVSENTANARGVKEIHAMPGNGGDLLMQVKGSQSGNNVFVDTMVFHRKGLVPVWERMISRSATRATSRRIDFTRDRIHVVSQVNDSAPTMRDLTPAASAFAFNQLELVLRSVPLREGYHAIVPLYSEGDNDMEMDTVIVSRVAGTHWHVRFADPMIISNWFIDAATRGVDSVRGGRQPTAPTPPH